jgi:uncharacterized protein YkwD
MAVGLLAIIAAAEVRAQAVPQEGSAQTEQRVHQRVNKVRAERGLKALTLDEKLSEVARSFSCRLARDDFFGHVSPSGEGLSDRLRASGHDVRAAGENIAKNNAKNPVERAVQGWIKSSGHRENMVSRDFTMTGVGVCVRGTTYYFTQIFVRPR